MPKGVYERKPRESTMSEATSEGAVAMFPVKLIKNYVPKGDYQVVGYLKPEIKRKDAAGVWRILEKEEFIDGHPAPPPHPGAGYGEHQSKDGSRVNAKIWAGTHIKLPVEEARRLVKLQIAERADDIAA